MIMKRRAFARSLFGAASLAVTLRLQGNPIPKVPAFDPTTYGGEVTHSAILSQEKLDEIYRQMREAGAKAWKERHFAVYKHVQGNILASSGILEKGLTSP